MDLVLKIVALILSSVAIFQLYEVRKKRHIDMFWKVYEIYTSNDQKLARKNTTLARKLFEKMNNHNEDELIDFYSKNYHLNDENDYENEKKNIDRSIMNRIRFFNQIGLLLSKRMVNKQMLFELIGIGLEHDYKTMKLILDTHRRDHNENKMYSNFEIMYSKFEKWKQKRESEYK